MLTGRDPLLKRVLNYFLDFDIKRELNKDESTKKTEIDGKKEKFKTASQGLVDEVCSRLSIDRILKLANETGATVGGDPFIGGELGESDIIALLKLMIRRSNIEIPITHNGLGYNNLIFISLIISNLSMVTSSQFGENAKVFPVLLIEEPEAHLHPALQYNFLRFLKNAIEEKEITRQIFITTHSTHITAAVELDSIICMTYNDKDSKIKVAYPGRVFSDSSEDQKSKKYIERYLDATKSNILFSKGIILAEGITEQLIIPCLAEYLDMPLEEKHVTVIGVGGSTFKHFIKLFGSGIVDDKIKFALSRRVSCIVDTDPSRRAKTDSKSRYKSCWPFEIEPDSKEYEYRPISNVVLNLEKISKDTVRIFYNKTGKGKTFEYDLIFENFKSNIIADVDFDEDNEITSVLDKCEWIKEDKDKAKFAAFYLQNIREKGENAFELEHQLRDNLKKDGSRKQELIIPNHIKNAINWACGQEIDDV